MPLDADWVLAPAASCFRIAAAVARGSVPAEHPLAAAFASPVKKLLDSCTVDRLDAPRLLDELTALAAGAAPPHELALTALRKLCDRAMADRVAPFVVPCVVELAEAGRAALPRLMDELELRTGPLKEQWEARGPGLLAGIARQTQPELLVERATILPVYPLRGGGGQALLAYNTVVIEAVLTNTVEALPEVVRLGWLLSQLNLDLPRFSEELKRSALVLPLAMIPPAVAAGAEVELVRDEAAARKLALEHWRPSDRLPPGVEQTLTTWWETYRENRPAWPLALAALEAML
jgi:hypothetical protein